MDECNVIGFINDPDEVVGFVNNDQTEVIGLIDNPDTVVGFVNCDCD